MATYTTEALLWAHILRLSRMPNRKAEMSKRINEYAYLTGCEKPRYPVPAIQTHVGWMAYETQSGAVAFMSYCETLRRDGYWKIVRTWVEDFVR